MNQRATTVHNSSLLQTLLISTKGAHRLSNHRIYHNLIISHFYKSLLKRIVCITLDLIPIKEMDIIKQYNLFMLLCLKVRNLFDHSFSFNLLKRIPHIKLEFTPKELSIFMKLFMLYFSRLITCMHLTMCLL